MKDSATFGTTPIINDPIISFYKGEGPDSCGRYIDEVWNFNYAKLEAVHDFIQWLFPLPKRSAFNPDAPLLTEQTALEFRRSDLLRFRLNRSFELMLGFYGLKFVKEEDGNLRILQSVKFPERSRVWLTPNNHNHLRLTRILESVRLLGMEKYSRALLSALEVIVREHPKCVSSRTVEFWRNATAG